MNKTCHKPLSFCLHTKTTSLALYLSNVPPGWRFNFRIILFGSTVPSFSLGKSFYFLSSSNTANASLTAVIHSLFCGDLRAISIDGSPSVWTGLFLGIQDLFFSPLAGSYAAGVFFTLVEFRWVCFGLFTLNLTSLFSYVIFTTSCVSFSSPKRSLSRSSTFSAETPFSPVNNWNNISCSVVFLSSKIWPTRSPWWFYCNTVFFHVVYDIAFWVFINDILWMQSDIFLFGMM